MPCRMVCGGDHDRIDGIPHFVEHPSPVLVALCTGEFFETTVGVPPIHVAQANDVFRGHRLQVRVALAAHPDPGNIEFVAGRAYAPIRSRRGWNNGDAGRENSGLLQKISSR